MNTTDEGVTYDWIRRAHVVVVVLDATEAENIAYALGLHDAGAQDLLRWAQEARERDEVGR